MTMVKEWRMILAEMAILICGMLGLIAKYWGVWVYLVCCVAGVASLFVIFGVGRIAGRRFSETIIGTWLVLCASVAGCVSGYIWFASMD